MSLTSDEMQCLQSYIDQDPKASALFQKLLQSYDTELHKICHELRNPLALISSTLQLIESQHPESRSFMYWNTLCEDLEYMMQLLEEFSQFNNSTTLHMKIFSLHSFMEKLVLSFAACCVDSDIEFTSQIEPDLPFITGDPVKLRQALVNLLKNARESIRGSGTITLTAWSEQQMIHIRIQDTGCGISDDLMKEIFTPFFTSKSYGTGLGLSITQNIIEAHSGTISVDSKVSSGTTFEIILPQNPDIS